MRQSTIEDQAQYQFHKILKRLHTEYVLDTQGVSFEMWLNRPGNSHEIAEVFLERVEEYCGIDEALENEY